MSMCEAGRQRGAAFAIRWLGTERRGEREAGESALAQSPEVKLLRALEEHRDCSCLDEVEPKRASMDIQGKEIAPQLSEEEGSRYYWELGRTLGQELLRRHEWGRDAHVGALNFRDSKRRAQSRLYSQHKLSNPSRFYREAARHPEGDIMDSMALALRRKVTLLDCKAMGAQRSC
ncbi:unnamed protein product [Ostreobium quekettii]|uniref:Uncharacterized protein n=1 Tax=Ostreobium quekettii TaxID=121088 RepID=A0A8S1J9U3_9CHLO|nr:unnamed protein product [Ostreobium quekettii]